MRAVIDTNILVSGLLGMYTPSARLIDMVYIGRIQCVYDDRILSEYKEVLAREKFKPVISEKERKDLLHYLSLSGIPVFCSPLEGYSNKAPDPFDLPFVEAAVAGHAECIITGNARHFSFFRNNPWQIEILSPRQCYTRICSG